ncbi:MAG: hypothetical protein SAJ12_02780 [Jaaginema sp. PMC 1079.18]|nr:hypothetical protein [Jaaginema sp. PMC 1080.18]MEC4849912.1 hypothetical protein [Jaaginema sp. PMC 1079.18]MEC4868848.1 hypothetical protein [Jaaginema sp. PMC 1078.18]
MSKTADRVSKSKQLLTTQNIIYTGIAWCFISLLFFLLFSETAPGEDPPFWFIISTYVFELGAFLASSLLCYRNWQSPQIASGRNVWLGMGLGLFCYFLGGVLFGIWELYFGLEPDVSLGDFFYMLFYFCISWGMTLAVLPRRLNLEVWQWVVVAVIALLAIILAFIVTFGNSEAALTPQNSPSEVTVLFVSEPTPTPTPVTTPVEPVPDKLDDLPGWVAGLDRFLSKLEGPVKLFYIIADVGLIIIATTLLLAFWGGRFSLSWRMIACATVFLYCADMWFQYAYSYIENYEGGGLPEVFFVFSGVFFGIGAALEYEVSTSRPSRSRRRRHG